MCICIATCVQCIARCVSSPSEVVCAFAYSVMCASQHVVGGGGGGVECTLSFRRSDQYCVSGMQGALSFRRSGMQGHCHSEGQACRGIVIQKVRHAGELSFRRSGMQGALSFRRSDQCCVSLFWGHAGAWPFKPSFLAFA